MQVTDSFAPKRRADPVAIELGIMPGSWNSAYIYKSLDTVGLQKRDELVLCSR